MGCILLGDASAPGSWSIPESLSWDLMTRAWPGCSVWGSPPGPESQAWCAGVRAVVKGGTASRQRFLEDLPRTMPLDSTPASQVAGGNPAGQFNRISWVGLGARGLLLKALGMGTMLGGQAVLALGSCSIYKAHGERHRLSPSWASVAQRGWGKVISCPAYCMRHFRAAKGREGVSGPSSGSAPVRWALPYACGEWDEAACPLSYHPLPTTGLSGVVGPCPCLQGLGVDGQ